MSLEGLHRLGLIAPLPGHTAFLQKAETLGLVGYTEAHALADAATFEMEFERIPLAAGFLRSMFASLSISVKDPVCLSDTYVRKIQRRLLCPFLTLNIEQSVRDMLGMV
jgi:hypothetical protein